MKATADSTDFKGHPLQDERGSALRVGSGRVINNVVKSFASLYQLSSQYS